MYKKATWKRNLLYFVRMGVYFVSAAVCFKTDLLLYTAYFSAYESLTNEKIQTKTVAFCSKSYTSELSSGGH